MQTAQFAAPQFAAPFGKPVLLINGDSHAYGSDHPLADPNSATGRVHGGSLPFGPLAARAD